jgi:hypothetical protein
MGGLFCSPLGSNTEERMRACPRVLCPQDTTELDFTPQPGITGLGWLSYECPQGMYLHPTLALTPEGACSARWTCGCRSVSLKVRRPLRRASAGSRAMSGSQR